MRKKTRGYLELVLKDDLVEGQPEFSLLERRDKTGLPEVIRAIELASRDRKVSAIALTLENLAAGWARLANLRRALWAFRRAGKPIYAFIASGGNAEYYVASACDRIYLPPGVTLQLVGLESEVFFFRDTLDRLGIEAELHSIGEYKTAGEPFTRTEMSPKSREQLEALLDDFHQEFCSALSDGRGLSSEEVAGRVDRGPYTAREAVDAGLADEICYRDELEQRLESALGVKLRAVPAHKYVPRPGWFRRLATVRRPRVAVVHVLGLIASGENRPKRAGRQVAGADTISELLDHALKDRRVRALVLRIDSPGGSATASDLIWRNVERLRHKKPVVATCGDFAASGGYYVASAASRILVEPTSITGSIGVLGGKFVALALQKYLGVHRETVRRGAHADHASPLSVFSREESQQLARQLEEFYRENFVRKVANGRHMPENEVDRLGRGRVWSGRQAVASGLADDVGGFGEAIEEARRLAGIPPARKTRTVFYARRRRLRDLFAFDLPFGALSLPWPVTELAEVAAALRSDPILAWLPWRIRIR